MLESNRYLRAYQERVNTGHSVPRTSLRVLERIEEALGSLALQLFTFTFVHQSKQFNLCKARQAQFNYIQHHSNTMLFIVLTNEGIICKIIKR